MPTTDSTLLNSLNLEQREAVEQIDGPVLVLAGPGTGKTHVLTTRVAHILKETDTQPKNILALTFSDAGAKTMQERLIQLIGIPAYELTISTFHAFASEIIMRHQSEYPQLLGYTQITELEQAEILEKILKEFKVTKLLVQGKVEKTIGQLNRTIQSIKQEELTPTILKKHLHDELDSLPDQPEKDTKKAKTELEVARKKLAKLEEFIPVLAAYQQELENRKRYDYADMVLFAIDLLKKNPDVLLELQERYHYVLVDEFQDTNNSQYTLLDLITTFWGEEANLFVVGDPDQTIYRFQGASVENVRRFQDRFPNAKTVQLLQNYRSTQLILDAAEQIILPNPDHARTESLRANSSGTPSKIEIITHASQLYEQIWIANQVQERIASGESPSEIAILTRSRKQVNALGDLFARMQIPFLLDKGVDAITHSSIQQLTRFLRAIVSMTEEKTDDPKLFSTMSQPWIDLDYTDVLTIFRYCADSRRSFGRYLLEEDWRKLNLNAPDKIDRFKQNLVEWTKLAMHSRVSSWLDLVVQQSGYLDYLLEDHSGVRLKAYHAIHSTVSTWEQQNPNFTHAQFFENLDRMIAQDIRISVETALNPEQAVTISTIHQSKGKEWNTVYLTNLVSGDWEKKNASEFLPPISTILKYQSVSDTEKIQELRRLFYVALTRAKQNCILSYGKKGDDLTAKDRLASLFIASIPKELSDSRSGELDHDRLLQTLGQLIKSPSTEQFSNTRWLNQLATGLNLSASSLNTFLECNYKFLLRHIFRIPTAISEHLEYGNAVHAAMERFFKIMMESEDAEVPKKQVLLELFEQQISTKSLPEDRIHALRQRGVEELAEYYDAYSSSWTKPLMVELQVGRAGGVQLDGIPLNGKIDRIDWVDQDADRVRILDYKTGRPKTNGEVEGTTKNSDGSTKRQLLFYALLLTLEPSFSHTVSEAIVSFVKKDSRGSDHREYVWEFSEAEIEEFKQVIKDAHAQIQTLQFPRTTNTSVCKNCDFRDHCWPEGIPSTEVEQSQAQLTLELDK